MSLENEVLKRVCGQEYERIYISLYDALLKHQDILLIANTGSGIMCPTLKAIQGQPVFSAHKPRIMLLLHDQNMLSELITSASAKNEDINIARISPRLHTNNSLRQLSAFPDLVSGTPSRIIEFIDKGYIDIQSFDAVVIEDVSGFQYLGYHEHLQHILDALGEHTKVILVSSLDNQSELPLPLRNKPHIVNELRLGFPFKYHAFTIISDEKEKPEALFSLLCELTSHPTIVFCNHRGSVIRLEKFLRAKKLSVGIIHGGLTDEQIAELMVLFHNGTIYALITTDRAVMDANLSDIAYIVHYHLPLNAQAYQRRNQVLMSHNLFGTAFHMLLEDEDQPDFIHTLPDVIHMELGSAAPVSSWWSTIKITVNQNVILHQNDIIELLLKYGKVHRDEIGLFDTVGTSYYMAVSSKKAERAVSKIDGLRFKGASIRANVVTMEYE